MAIPKIFSIYWNFLIIFIYSWLKKAALMTFRFHFPLSLLIRRCLFGLTILCALSTLPCPSASAGPVLTISPDQQFDFADRYFSRGEYLKAIGEYERFIYFFPKDHRITQAKFSIAQAYFESRRFQDAIRAFESIIEGHHGKSLSDFVTKSYFMISKCHLRLGAPGSAIITLRNLLALSDNSDLNDEIRYKIGWIHIETAAWEKALSYFKQISLKNQNKYRLEALSAELSQTHRIPKKSPCVAGILSIIPGAGYVYCGRYKDALIAFLLNGGLAYAAYEAFDHDSNALGGLIAVVEMGFYTGNIYGSVSSAHKHNQSKAARFIENLKKNTKLRVSRGSQNQDIALSLEYAF